MKAQRCQLANGDMGWKWGNAGTGRATKAEALKDGLVSIEGGQAVSAPASIAKSEVPPKGEAPMKDGFRIFAQLQKVDAEKRLVYGRAASEEVDKVGEILDYASSKPYFKKWSDEIAADTDGKSLGNVRAMHGKIAAGKLTTIDFNDAEKAIDVCAKVVDDNEWNKVMEGVYTGFSIGGSYVGDKKTEKMDGKDVTRYTASPAEISLVDRPCMPTAKFFDVVKHNDAGKEVHLMKVAFIERDEEALAILDKIDGQAKITENVSTEGRQSTQPAGAAANGATTAASDDDGPNDGTKKPKVVNGITEVAAAEAGERQAAVVGAAGEHQEHQSANGKVATVDDKGVKKTGAPAAGQEVEVQVQGSAEEVIALGKLMTDNKFNMSTILKIVGDAASYAAVDTVLVETAPLPTLAFAKYLEDNKDKVAKLVKQDFVGQKRAALADHGKALPDGSFPVVTKTDLVLALTAYEKAKDKDATKAHLIKRAKALSCTEFLPKDWGVKVDTGTIQKMLSEGLVKGMYDVAQLVTVVQSLYGLCKNAWYEREGEQDDSMVPDRLKQCVEDLIGVLKTMVDEESGELIDSINPLDKVDAVGLFARLAKAGARHGKDDMARVQKVHDLSCDLGAGCAAAKADGLEPEKAAMGMDKATGNAFEKLVASAVAKATAPLLERVTKAEEQVKKLEDQPAPTTVVLKAVAKGADLGSGADKAGEKKEVSPIMKGKEVAEAATGIKKIHAQGGVSLLGVGQ